MCTVVSQYAPPSSLSTPVQSPQSTPLQLNLSTPTHLPQTTLSQSLQSAQPPTTNEEAITPANCSTHNSNTVSSLNSTLAPSNQFFPVTTSMSHTKRTVYLQKFFFTTGLHSTVEASRQIAFLVRNFEDSSQPEVLGYLEKNQPAAEAVSRVP